MPRSGGGAAPNSGGSSTSATAGERDGDAGGDADEDVAADARIAEAAAEQAAPRHEDLRAVAADIRFERDVDQPEDRRVQQLAARRSPRESD